MTRWWRDSLSGEETIQPFPAETLVTLCLDGSSVLAALSSDLGEHERRTAIGASSVTCSRLLHGLWLLPSGVPVPARELPDVKVSRLRQARAHVRETCRGFERLYSPAGAVRSLGFLAASPERGILRASRHSPIFERTVFVDRSSSVTDRVLRLALDKGIGLTIVDGGALTTVIPAAPRELGVPSVYRWWIAEVAYQAALDQRSDQLTS